MEWTGDANVGVTADFAPPVLFDTRIRKKGGDWSLGLVLPFNNVQLSGLESLKAGEEYEIMQQRLDPNLNPFPDSEPDIRSVTVEGIDRR